MTRCAIGTDVGGTFTDLVFCTAAGEVHCFKVPSTPTRPGESILTGVDEISATLHPDAPAWRQAHHTHSSTVATNALIERRGARVGLIATSGFRDLFELQRLAIPHPMRFDSRRPLPLVPRELVRELLHHRMARERAIETALGAGAANTYTLMDTLYSQVHPRLRRAAERNVLAHLLKLEGEGKVTRDGEVWRAA